MIIVVAGVSGSGKTTIGEMLARRLAVPYAEADSFHPAANIAKMSAGIPLNDDDRKPWLQAIADYADARLEAGESAVVTCSALKRRYRDFLRAGRPLLHIVYLDGDRETIGRRLSSRAGHFFPPQLLDSQFRDLEPPSPDEGVLAVPVEQAPEQIVEAIVRALSLPKG